MLTMPKKLLHIVRNKMKKNHDNWLKKEKSYLKSKNVKKMLKKHKFFGSKIHKGAGIWEKQEPF